MKNDLFVCVIDVLKTVSDYLSGDGRFDLERSLLEDIVRDIGLMRMGLCRERRLQEEQ